MAFLVLGLLAACGPARPPVGQIGHVVGDFGGAVSDEPTASLIAGDVLSSGGKAADAAVALYFGLAVTFPSAASLGGGGVCVVHDRAAGKVEAIDFTTARPARRPDGGQPEFAVPGNVRGMAALHARYGNLRWSQVVLPAERIARFGNPVSRAISHEIRRYAPIMVASEDLTGLFGGSGGKVLDEGEDLRQLDLSVVLGAVRGRGAGEFYTGVLAQRIAAAYRAAGATVTVEDLRNYRPVWRETVKGSFGNHDVHFAPPPVVGGAAAAKMWDALKEKGAYEDAAKDARNRVVVEAAAGTGAVLGQPAVDGEIPDHAVTSFAVIDQLGNAVACSVTMNAPFGVARVLPGTGIIAGAAPGPGRDGRASLAPMLIVNAPTGNAYLAAGTSGNSSAPTAMIMAALKLLLDERKLGEAVDAARFYPGEGRTLYAEAKADAGETARFEADGYRIVRVPSLGRVNAIWCADGVPLRKESCRFVTDSRGFGYAVSAEAR